MGTPKETRQSKVFASLIPAKSLNNTQTLRVVWFITFNFLILLSSDLIINTPIYISPELSGYVIDLQNFDSIIKKAYSYVEHSKFPRFWSNSE